MIERIRLVAARDFLATVRAKGFLIGLVVVPTIVLLAVLLGPRLLSSDEVGVSGQIEVVDPTGAVAARLQAAIDSGMAAARTAFGSSRAHAAVRESTTIAASGRTPRITVVVPRGNGGVQPDTRWLLASSHGTSGRLAIVSVHPDAVVRASGHAGYGSYSLYLAANVDPAAEAIVRKGMRAALIAARFSRDGIDPQSAESMLNIAKPQVAVVTRAGQQPPRPALAMLLPLSCAVLLLLGVTMGGQLLLTSTVEEKASRVVEVLLAAVSPVELMAGKLIGQLGVGMLIVGM